ncbi:hypothetical protein [Acinetobacter sp. LoGeW2-3]|nr:hypothetical protein [Acinetobacter sp. LoGeW2-3]
MKLLTLMSVGVAASYCYKVIKNNQPALATSDFDETIKQVLLKEFSA